MSKYEVVKIELEVRVEISERQDEWKINVRNKKNGEHVRELERNYYTEDECMEYIASLVKDDRYTTHLI